MRELAPLQRDLGARAADEPMRGCQAAFGDQPQPRLATCSGSPANEHAPANTEPAVLAHDGPPHIEQRDKRDESATLNRQVFTPIAAVLNYAAKRGMCAHRVIERPPQPKGRIRWITFEEAERLIHACSPHLRPLVMFLLGTGSRMSEALSLEWREVDLAAAHVTFLDTKNGEDRGVPLHARLVNELRALRHQQGRVFRTNSGLPYAEKDNAGGQIKTAFRGACRRAGIEDFSPHDCRHTWATWHYAANRDIVALMKLGGWKSERMVLRYAHVNVSQLAPSIDAGLAAWSTKSAPALSERGQKLRRVK